MDNQKLENLLNLALDSTQEELEKSANLGSGYNPEERTWELIVKYSGDISFLQEMGITVYEMLNEFAILTVPEHLIDALTDFPQIEYVEKPKRLFFAVNQARAVSCINPVQSGRNPLTGKGVVVGIVDSGIDYYHEDFRTKDGRTRILYLWDQALDRIFTQQEIDKALEAGDRASARKVVPSADINGHGTAVAGIAAGNGRESGGRYRGAAYESPLIIVKLGAPEEGGFPRTTELMKAVDFVVRASIRLEMPAAVNLSFGNTYGSHDGTSLIERFLDDISNFGRISIVVGSGNEGNTGGHTSGILSEGKTEQVELSVAPYETGFSVQIWKDYVDRFAVSLMTPGGSLLSVTDQGGGSRTLSYGDTKILVYYGEPGPYSQAQEIYLDFQPVKDYVDSGIWTFRLEPQSIIDGRYDMWLPSVGILNRSTLFLRPTPDITLTIPSTASQVITVGAYDSRYQAYADFSGRGYTRVTNLVKPDLAAPGVNITAARAGGGYDTMTGTSFAAPFVTGSAALMMQWGIADGNDPFLYGEKVKAYLRRGARHLPGVDDWPNERLGWGALCLADSFPE